jgi:hypothetical protein
MKNTAAAHTGRHFLQIPGPTNVPDRVLQAIGMPTIDHRGSEFATLGQGVIASKLCQQQNSRFALHKAVHDGAEHRDVARHSIIVRSTNSTALGPSSTIRRVGRHRAVKARKIADAERLVLWDWLQVQLDR